jgi:signal transduction histidine kinase
MAADTETWLVNLPPTTSQRRLARAAAIVLILGFGALVPFAGAQLTPFDAFIPTLDATIFVIDLITAILLFAQFSIYRSRALLALACGYLFTALIVIPHALTFPGAFSPSGLLGGGLQTTAWIYIFWHFGFPIALLAYAWLREQNREISPQDSTRSIVGWSALAMCALVCGLVLLAVEGDRFLPHIFLDRAHTGPIARYVIVVATLLCGCALIVMWTRRRSLLDEWLMVVALAASSELVFTGLLSDVRFSVGFYAGRTLSLITSTVVITVLLAETTRLYARLAKTNTVLRREQSNKLMNLEALVASISHEVKQPLSAIATNGSAALQLLRNNVLDLDEVRSAISDIVSDSHRAAQVFESIRALYSVDYPQEPIDLNEVALRALRSLRGELTDHDITTRVALMAELPPIVGHSGQLQEVVTNLLHNAMEAMEAMSDNRRFLKVTTEYDGGKTVVLAVEDAGPGIDPKRLESIFDAFVTTKPDGMGLGLAICRMIVERHGGRLTASSDGKNGSLFQFVLPVGRIGASAAA